MATDEWIPSVLKAKLFPRPFFFHCVVAIKVEAVGLQRKKEENKTSTRQRWKMSRKKGGEEEEWRKRSALDGPRIIGYNASSSPPPPTRSQSIFTPGWRNGNQPRVSVLLLLYSFSSIPATWSDKLVIRRYASDHCETAMFVSTECGPLDKTKERKTEG